ncbi:Folate transporter 1, chloroplastic [Vitis vinifera]|uniref:Folate transporter 1, chloroplastic n=1 Tax=Vitis vinifera TaxID=29760 RepID=A0A438K5T7_VITVI|nr:Folate transporter 1, chloroplastic [Vitis vinifera]
MSALDRRKWEWENATAGAIAGFATVAAMHPLDVVLNDGRLANLPTYKNTAHAIFTITRLEGLRGLYAGFYPAVLGSTVSWGLYFFFYGRAKQRYSKNGTQKLSPGLHLASAAEAGALVSTCAYNDLIWKNTICSAQIPTGLVAPTTDALRTILKEEGWSALYRGIAPSLFLQVSHGAVQFMVYEELRKFVVEFKCKESNKNLGSDAKLLDSVDYAVLGASSKLAAILMTYPFQVIRARLQQRPNRDGIPRYMDSWHVVKETARFEGFRGFYKGITPSILKNLPVASITFVVYENVLNLLRLKRRND